MPLWNIYHSTGTLSADDKKAVAEVLTGMYARVMPRFYVGVIFHEISGENFYVGGERQSNFVRISVDHIARAFQSKESMSKFMSAVGRALAPWISDRGLGWEIHVDETPFDLWTIQGHFPPPEGSDDEKRWRSENKPSPPTQS